MSAQHTPELLGVGLTRPQKVSPGEPQWVDVPLRVKSADPKIGMGNCVATVHLGGFGGTTCSQEAVEATAQRIASCYNALAGLNPEAVKDVVSALELSIEFTGKLVTNPEWKRHAELVSLNEDATAALAKLKEGAS